MEGVGHDRLHRVLAQFGNQPVALGGGLQRVDGLVQIKLIALPQRGAGLGAGDEDLERRRTRLRTIGCAARCRSARWANLHLGPRYLSDG